MSSKLELLTQRNYLSYSALSSYLDCSERFRLERVLGAQQTKAWWFLGGDAVHKATEYLDLGELDDPTIAWARAWSTALETIEPGEEIKAGGRKSKQWPDKENKDWWEYHGPQFVANWLTWRNASLAAGWSFLELPDGKPAIEVPVQFEADDVLVKGYIDRVMVDNNGQVVVVDLKSGSRAPASSLQLAVYALGLERNLGVTATLGAYWMARDGALDGLHSLSHLTDALLSTWFSNAKKGIENEIFIPKVSPLCTTCSVAKYCSAVGGNPSPLL